MYKEYKEAWAELISAGADFEIEKIEVRGASINTYKNALPTLKHMWEQTRQFGDRDYLVYQDERFSYTCLLYTSPSPRDRQKSRMPSSA